MTPTTLTSPSRPMYTHSQMLQIVSTVVQNLLHSGESETPSANLDNEIAQRIVLPAEKLTYSVEEVAQACGLSKPSVYRMVHDGELHAVHSGKRILIPKAALAAWVENGGQ